MAMLRGCSLLKCIGVFQYPTRVGVVASRTLRSSRVPRVASAVDNVFSDTYSPNTLIKETGFGAVRLDKHNIPQRHGEFEIQPKKSLVGFDDAHPHEDLEGIMEKTTTHLPLAGEHRDPKPQSTTSTEAHNKSQGESKNKKRKPRPIREIFEDDIQTVKKAVVSEPDSTEPKSAFEAVKNIRNEFESEETKVLKRKKQLVDSKGFRVMKEEIEPPLRLMTHDQILQSLRRRVILDTPEVLVINKPYGLSMHGGGDVSSKSKFALTAYLPELSTFFGAEKLYTVHRLDKEVTGVLCLAKNSHFANVIEMMFKAHQVKKEYLGITKGVINQREGIIELPIAVGHIDGKERMVIVPRPPPDSKKSVPKFRRIFEARTQYEIVSSWNSAAYWKLKPLTGYKHQIRVHLGFGLQCPLIGDHKYSNVKKLVPQKLPGDILHSLNVRQEKVREIPLFLHSKSITIPGILEGGRNLVAHCNPPKHFTKTLKELKLV